MFSPSPPAGMRADSPTLALKVTGSSHTRNCGLCCRRSTSRNSPHPKGSITITIISHCLMWLSTPKHPAENSDSFQTLSSHFWKVALQFLCNYSEKNPNQPPNYLLLESCRLLAECCPAAGWIPWPTQTRRLCGKLTQCLGMPSQASKQFITTSFSKSVPWSKTNTWATPLLWKKDM